MTDELSDTDFPQTPGWSAVAELARAFDALREELDAHEQELDRQMAADQKRDQQADEARAERARSGELGIEWQRLQRRIDAGQTSVRDIFLGVDESEEAQRLRDRAQRNLAEVHNRWEQEADKRPTDGVENPIGLAHAFRAEQAEHLRRVQEAIANLADLDRPQ